MLPLSTHLFSHWSIPLTSLLYRAIHHAADRIQDSPITLFDLICMGLVYFWLTAESIERIIVVQAFSRSYNLAPRPPPSPSVISTSDAHWKTEKERQLADGTGGRGVGRELNHTTARKPGIL
jgi:hypothetical protein